MIEKIITHNGVFHADELFAIALVHEFVQECPVVRTRTITAEDMDNPNIWIIDVGGKHSTYINVFDHHHDKALHASCVLILKHMFRTNIISEELYDEMIDEMLIVSNIDCDGYGEYNGFQVNSFIKRMNNIPGGFEFALEMCRNYVRSCKAVIEVSKESLEIWQRGVNINDNIKICDAFPIHWKRYNMKQFLIYPNDGKWTLLSIDSSVYPIKNIGKHEFLHQGRFIAVFVDKNDAIDCAVASTN
jgi:hypothetical protein